MNKVYQYGDELFVTLDAMPRLRNLRTGLTLRVRRDFDKHFKYLGEMPQVGQVWVGNLTKYGKAIQRIRGCSVYVKDSIGVEYEVRLVALLRNHALQPEQKAVWAEEDEPLVKPNFHFATGHKDALNVKAKDRRFTAAEVGTAAHKKFEEYMMKDIEAEKHALYMAPDGGVWSLSRRYERTVVLVRPNTDLHVDEGTFKAKYRALPIPGQLWAKGKRYVTVDRVEDGRVYYTDGSSGLRRFLNEYCRVGALVIDFAGLPTGAGKTVVMQQMLGRKLRPTPITETRPCPIGQPTLKRMRDGDELYNWTQYRNTLGEKIRYANQRIKELSK